MTRPAARQFRAPTRQRLQSRRRPARVRPDRTALVPLILLRAAAAITATLLGAVVWNGSAWIVLPVLVAICAAFLPSLGLVTLTLLMLVVAYAVNMPGGSPWLLVFVAGLHALFILHLLLLPLPLTGWISARALGELGIAFLRIQLAAQPIALLALVVDDAGSSLAAVVVGVAALTGWGVWMTASARRRY